MLSIPLPFIVSALLAFLLYRNVGRSGVAGSKLYFRLFLGLCVLQGLITGLHFGYGFTSLSGLQPISAALVPGLAFLGFSTLGDSRIDRPWLHLLAPLAIVLIMSTFGGLLDLALVVLFAGYSVALWKVAERQDEAFAHARLEGAEGIVHAARLTAALLMFSAISDAVLAIYLGVYGPGSAPALVGIVNLLVLAAITYGFLRSLSPAMPHPVRQAKAAAIEDREAERLFATVTRVEHLLDETRLFADSNLNLSRLSRRLNLPSRDVSTAINAQTGLNVSQFVNNRRIAEACRQLLESNRPTIEIMHECGFSTKSNFNREFRRVTGMSPRDWRNQPASDSSGTGGLQQQLGNA